MAQLSGRNLDKFSRRKNKLMADKTTRKTRILWAGKRRADIPTFVPDLEAKGYKVTFVNTGKEALNC
jgi:hypothetical protein